MVLAVPATARQPVDYILQTKLQHVLGEPSGCIWANVSTADRSYVAVQFFRGRRCVHEHRFIYAMARTDREWNVVEVQTYNPDRFRCSPNLPEGVARDLQLCRRSTNREHRCELPAELDSANVKVWTRAIRCGHGLDLYNAFFRACRPGPRYAWLCTRRRVRGFDCRAQVHDVYDTGRCAQGRRNRVRWVNGA